MNARKSRQLECRARPPVRLVLSSSVVMLALGCANPHGQIVPFLKAHEQAVATGHYTVMPPDVLRIHAPVSPEVDGVAAQVRPDGKITLRLVGDVDVAGLTTEQVAAKLREQLSRYYVEPEVLVDVAEYASQHYFVFGEVGAPGRKPFTGRDTLLGALADARPTFLAWRSQIRVVRPSPDGREPKIITVDLERMVRSGSTTENVLLEPGDIIEVPPTPLAWMGLRVRELLYPITPIVEAYDAPARSIESTRTYEYELGDRNREVPRHYR